MKSPGPDDYQTLQDELESWTLQSSNHETTDDGYEIPSAESESRMLEGTEEETSVYDDLEGWLYYESKYYYDVFCWDDQDFNYKGL